jgi:hypothetical protein
MIITILFLKFIINFIIFFTKIFNFLYVFFNLFIVIIINETLNLRKYFKIIKLLSFIIKMMKIIFMLNTILIIY